MRRASAPSRRLPPRSQAIKRVVVISKRGRFLVGELLFERGGRISLSGGRRAATPGRMALVDIGANRSRGARVLRELGAPTVAADVVEALLLDRGVRRGFPRELEREAAAAAEAAARESRERRDLTGLATFTVDPATARDFDDAVSAEPIESGVRLWIHIADVAAHIAPGTVAKPIALARRAAAAFRESRAGSSLDVQSLEPEFRFEDGDVVGARNL